MTAEMQSPLISVVIPMYQESAHAGAVLAELAAILVNETFEIVAIDDGSTDSTWAELEKASLRIHDLRAHKLSRNFGKELAISAGLADARGDAVIVMDGDGQHPPQMTVQLISAWRESNADIV